MGQDTPAYILAALTAGGGITGYIRTGSIPSIAAGCTVGALVGIPISPSRVLDCYACDTIAKIPRLSHIPPQSLSTSHLSHFANTSLPQYGLGGYRIQQRQSYGVELALLASVILAGSSIPRAIRSQKPLPAGLSMLALFGLWTFGNAYRLGYKVKSV
ncbi:hypothetical protein MMC26_005184 [Xylographa opegraphella]|nr:hypothetical protein [Xylographa opegraphella]